MAPNSLYAPVKLLESSPDSVLEPHLPVGGLAHDLTLHHSSRMQSDSIAFFRTLCFLQSLPYSSILCLLTSNSYLNASGLREFPGPPSKLSSIPVAPTPCDWLPQKSTWPLATLAPRLPWPLTNTPQILFGFFPLIIPSSCYLNITLSKF